MTTPTTPTTPTVGPTLDSIVARHTDDLDTIAERIVDAITDASAPLTPNAWADLCRRLEHRLAAQAAAVEEFQRAQHARMGRQTVTVTIQGQAWDWFQQHADTIGTDPALVGRLTSAAVVRPKGRGYATDLNGVAADDALALAGEFDRVLNCPDKSRHDYNPSQQVAMRRGVDAIITTLRPMGLV